MSKIFLFKPRAELNSEINLKNFINKCRHELTVFDPNLDWDSHIWPKIAVFAKLGVITRKPTANQIMDVNFIEFAKAYLRYQQGHKPTSVKQELKALKAVEAALIQVYTKPSITKLSFACLDEAAILAKAHYSPKAAYHCGRELEKLVDFLSDNYLIPNNLKTWKNPIIRPDDTIKTSKAAKIAREEKLPDSMALNCLAEIFANSPTNERDIFTTSIFAMLMSAPSRITEILTLPIDCEIIEKDNKGIERYGWRFFSKKGFEGDIKWIPTVMVDVAKTAIHRIKNISHNARDLALWIENNPQKFYRHKNCPNVSDDTLLTAKQVCQALGLMNSSPETINSNLDNRKLNKVDYTYTLNDLWSYTKKRLPPSFPWFDKNTNLKYSDALFALNKNQFHGNRSVLPIELHKPSNNFFNNDLNPRESLKGVHRSIFCRHGYFSITGQQLKITSHQARHLLNTIAQRGGLSNLEIAKWSGRADIKQNRIYNHMSEHEMVALAEKIDITKPIYKSYEDIQYHIPATNQAFNTIEQAAIHVTEYGFCTHDYTMSPCEKYRDCINCTEQICIKGNTEKLNRIKEQLQKTESLLLIAGKAQKEGNIGADRWFMFHKKTASRLHELINILENPSIEDGAQIKLKGNDFSQLLRVVEKKSQTGLDNSAGKTEEASLLDEISTLLGDSFG